MSRPLKESTLDWITWHYGGLLYCAEPDCEDMPMEIFNDLLTEIESIPAIDIHSHIQAISPAASGPADVLLYHYIKTELKSAGVPAKLLDSDDPPRLPDIVAHFSKIKNTTTYWCLSQILKDIYGIDSEPCEADLDEITTAIEKSANNPNRAGEVLDRANISKVFITCEWHRSIPKPTDYFVPTLRLDSLINEPHMSRTLDKLGEASGMSIYEAGDMKKAISELVFKAKEAGAVAASASFGPQVDFEEGSRDASDRIISLVMLGQKTNRDDRKALRSYVIDLVLTACAEHDIPFQMMIGVCRQMAGDVTISAYESGMLAGYTDLFARHSGVKFDVIAAHETLASELAVVSRNYRNVYTSGYWWYMMFPTRIRKVIRERVEMLPINKTNGFFSDAYCVEWAYGKSKLARRELAIALSQMVDEGYLSRQAAVDIATHYLNSNPAKIYSMK